MLDTLCSKPIQHDCEEKGDVTRIILPHPEIDVATLFEAEYRDRKQMNNDKLCQSINI
ncbi:MAG: hypothetical protein NMNS01_16140 [Nitrosomonas sp.]|nr:MAG: hypothetical protein NMNS01_16140 [Nitrosomonas sp.]